MEDATHIDEKRLDLEALLDSIASEAPLNASNAPSHFEYAQRFMNEIAALGALPLLGPEGTTPHERYAMHISLFGQLAPYQYKAYLLDPFLEDMIRPLITPIQKLIHQVNDGGHHEGESMNDNGNEVFRMLYIITKTRGFKTVVKFLPHEVADFEPTFAFFCKQDRKDHLNWEVRYMLLVWLSLMCMIPFDLKSVDSGASKDSNKLPLVDKMVETAKSFLDCAGKDRDGSALFLARLLTRKDTCNTYLPEFVQWSREIMSSSPTIFHAIGVLSTLCWIFKLAQRETLLPIAADVEMVLADTEARDNFSSNASVKKLVVKLSQRVGLCLLKPRVATWRYQRGSRSLLTNLQQTGSGIAANNTSLTIANPEVEEEEIEVPEEIEGVIERLMNGLRDRDTIVRWSSAKGIGRISNRLPQDMADDVVGSVFELFSEDVFKGPDGELDISAASEHTWHGACLAIAELSQRGLLLPHRLQEIIPWIIRALKFDLKRGAHSVGSNVRDASCYVCWAFARAYSPEILSSHVRDLSNTLVAVSVFDRDINIRRAASAAFQENVGRMGIFPHGIDIVTIADYFAVGNLSNSFLNVAPEIASFEEYRLNLINHLVDTTISHWDTAVRELASESLAKMAILDWEYATQSIIPQLLPMVQSLDPAVRHGSLLSLGRLCLALKVHLGMPESQWLPPSVCDEIAHVVVKTPEMLLVGFGSEHIRQALCVFLTCLSQAHWKMDDISLQASRELVYSTLKRTEEPLQRLAADTFKAVVDAYDLSLVDFEQSLRNVDPTSERFTRRGFALALGEIDYRQEARTGWLSRIIPALALNAKILTPAEMTSPDAQDAESRRNSLTAMTTILRNLDSRFQNVASRQETADILKMYFTAMNDYSVDHRGDVGSWVREASMLGFEVMTPLLARLDRSLPEEKRYLNKADYVQIISILLLESVEKIDRMRAIAAKVLTTLLHARIHIEGEDLMDHDQSHHLLDVPHRDKLVQVFELESEINWLYPAEVYKRVVHFLHLPEYRSDLLVGFVVSAGGLTETLVRYSSTCLIEFVGNLAITNTAMETDNTLSSSNSNSSAPELTLVEFGNEIMKIVDKYEGQDRVIVPLLETLNMLLEAGVLLLMEDEYNFAPMVKFVQRQTLRCKDVRKLSVAVNVFCGLCGLGGKYKRAILLELLRLLVHPFPKIRKTTADAMYLMMNSSIDEPTPETEQAAQIIADTDWNLAVSAVTPIRDSLYPLLGLTKPVPVAAPSTAGRASIRR